jgi:C4-type Zn-finger protein
MQGATITISCTDVDRLSVPLLRSTEAAIEIDSSTSLDVYFHLMSASTIGLSGNILS